jgi:hypothetical protein
MANQILKEFTKNLRLGFLCLTLLILNNNSLFGNLLHEETKTINKSFKISKLGDLNVDNRYGNIKIESWDREEVSFQIDIKVSSNSKSKAQEAIDDVSITFTSMSNEVSAVTEIGNSNSSSGFWSWIGNNTNLSYKIHYYIRCPKSLNLGLTNKYGNISLPDWTGNAVLNVSYGSLTTQDMSAKTKAFVSYGSFDMKNINDLYTVVKYSEGKLTNANLLDMQVSYSDIKVMSASKVTGTNKYSDIKIDNVSTSATFTGNYNDYKIGEAAVVTLKGSYTDITIQNLLTQFTTEQNYGAASIKNVSSTAKAINFIGKYTGFSINGMSNFNLKYNGKYANPSLPASFKYRVKDKDGSAFSCEGEEGNGKIDVRISTSYGGVKIQ